MIRRHQESKKEAAITGQSYDRRQFDIISGDFNDDNMAYYLYSYTAEGDSLHLVLANRSTELNYTSRTLHRFYSSILEGKNLIAGDLDRDGLGEFVVGYRTFDDNLARLAVMGFDDREDIVAVNHYFNNGPVGDQGFSLILVRFDSLLNSTRAEWKTQYEEISNGGGSGNQETHFAVSLSDFDGDLFRIGE